MCRVLFGSWLALRMPLQCPFSKPSGAESQVFKTESGPELYIYVNNFKTHTHIYIFFDENYASECIVHEFLFIYVSLDSGIVHIQISVQGLPKARSKGQAEF